MSSNQYYRNIQPFLYDSMNEIEASFLPATLNPVNNAMYRLFFRYNYEEMFSLFDFENLPDEWDKRYFINMLLCRGWIAVVKTDTYGWIPQQAVWGAGRNVFHFPTSVLVNNPYFNPANRQTEYYIRRITDSDGTIHDIDGYIVNMTPDFMGVADLAAFYAVKMASLFSTFDNSAVLARNGFILSADSKADSMTIEKAVEGILNGDLIVTLKSKRKAGQTEERLIEPFESDVRKHYIITDILNDFYSLRDMFHTEIGFPTINRDKKGRNLAGEQAAQEFTSTVKSDLWFNCLKQSVDKFNSAAGFEITVKRNYDYAGYGNIAGRMEVGGDGNVSKDTIQHTG